MVKEHAVGRRSVMKAAGAAAGLALGGLSGAGAASGRQVSSRPGWRRYPLRLFGDPRFTFPTVEGRQDDQGTDTWYLDAAIVTTSGRRLAFSTIFCKNRLPGELRADFHALGFYDLGSGDYGTSVPTDLPPAGLLSPPKLHMASGHLGLSFDGPQGTSTWRTRRRAGHLVPFEYRLDLRGEDQHGRAMRLSCVQIPQNPPTVVGRGQGYIECFGQTGTGTYFQTGQRVRGTITWGGRTEDFEGHVGHMDRQFFPQYAGEKVGLFARDRSHEWRTINLSDGTDLSLWRQFDRTDRNSLSGFSGATRFIPGPGRGTTRFSPDLEVETTSYVKWPESVQTAFPPPSPNRYCPDGHVLRVPAWELELTAHTLVPAPAHPLPVEYMFGPVHYRGHLRDTPIEGFGIFERTLALYRPFELAQVLATTAEHLPRAAVHEGSVSPSSLQRLTRRLVRKVDQDPLLTSRAFLLDRVRPACATLQGPTRAFMLEACDDLLTALPTLPATP
ncbi:secreted hydrolase [Nocardioides acrostichi]|uniref:Secreted hydrolase n=1 Tax=Nocardioides acrostichi TaxID=2784339 RepID=A0A930UZA4_9ACTN|nr:secreted hydrolase [Nocardioides acrostichi]MBF4160785.1 secreted hydrolase [Nocardioides acrostichi]